MNFDAEPAPIFAYSEQVSANDLTYMPSSPPAKKKKAPVTESEFTFHIIGKKAAKGGSSSAVGAIVSGPVSALVGDALGSAFGTATEAHLIKAVKADAKAKPSSKKKAAKPKTKRRKRRADS
jgi:hypothetical protein